MLLGNRDDVLLSGLWDQCNVNACCRQLDAALKEVDRLKRVLAAY